jgi:hypothetical protein
MAFCRSFSLPGGAPGGRCPPFFFGMWTRRTGVDRWRWLPYFCIGDQKRAESRQGCTPCERHLPVAIFVRCVLRRLQRPFRHVSSRVPLCACQSERSTIFCQVIGTAGLGTPAAAALPWTLWSVGNPLCSWQRFFQVSTVTWVAGVFPLGEPLRQVSMKIQAVWPFL